MSDTADSAATPGRRREDIPRGFRQAQGVFVVHHHGAGHRPFGNPHVHALLSPVTTLGTTYWVPKARLEQVKARWEREVLASLTSVERREGLSPARQSERGPRPTLDEILLARRPARERARTLPIPARSLLQMARAADQPGRSGERRARRLTFRLLTPALPRELRTALVLARTAVRVGGGDGE